MRDIIPFADAEGEEIVPGATREGIVAGAAGQDVVTGFTVELIVAVAAKKFVIRRVAVNGVVTGAAVDAADIQKVRIAEIEGVIVIGSLGVADRIAAIDSFNAVTSGVSVVRTFGPVERLD